MPSLEADLVDLFHVGVACYDDHGGFGRVGEGGNLELQLRFDAKIKVVLYIAEIRQVERTCDDSIGVEGFGHVSD